MAGGRSKGGESIPDVHWLPSRAFANVWGITDTTLASRGVLSSKESGRVEYSLQDFWLKCADLVHKRLSESYTTLDGATLEELKAEKEKETVRKLKLENDEKEGLLVRADQVEMDYGRGMKAVSDTLDSAISRVKVAVPDIPQSALAAIEEIMTDVRRKAVRLEIE
jgi:hypothetical protein